MTKNRVCGTIVAICSTIFIALMPFYDKINTKYAFLHNLLQSKEISPQQLIQLNQTENQGTLIICLMFASVLIDFIVFCIWFEVKINVGQFPIDY